MLTEDKQRAALLAEAQALLQQELSEHRAVFEATALMLGGPFVETLDILETAAVRPMRSTSRRSWSSATRPIERRSQPLH
jgi:hypothetical protein